MLTHVVQPQTLNRFPHGWGRGRTRRRDKKRERGESDFSFHGNRLNKDFNRQEYGSSQLLSFSTVLLRQNLNASQSSLSQDQYYNLVPETYHFEFKLFCDSYNHSFIQLAF